MDAVQILMLLLTGVLAVGLCYVAIMMLLRDLGNASAWKRDEPEICRTVERTTEQPIVEKMMLNASMTDEFSSRTIFWLWLAFTRDYVVLVQRDQPAGEDEARTVLAERKGAKFRRMSKRYSELTLSDPEGGDPLKIYLCVRPRDTEKLERLLRS